MHNHLDLGRFLHYQPALLTPPQSSASQVVSNGPSHPLQAPNVHLFARPCRLLGGFVVPEAAHALQDLLQSVQGSHQASLTGTELLCIDFSAHTYFSICGMHKWHAQPPGKTDKKERKRLCTLGPAARIPQQKDSPVGNSSKPASKGLTKASLTGTE
eukprot:scaffold74752_cov17-Tisochrysis_lutea.AAC.3